MTNSIGALQVAHIDHIVLRVKDLERSIEWYTAVLGCKLSRQLKPPLSLAQMKAGTSMIDLCAADGVVGKERGAPPAAEGHNMHHVCLKVDSFDEGALVKHFESHGITPFDICKRFGADGYGPCMYIADPDGNWIEIKGPSEPPLPGVS